MTYYAHPDWEGWRHCFQGEKPEAYVACRFYFGAVGEWLAGPFQTSAEAWDARDTLRAVGKAGSVTLAVLAVKAR